MGFCLSLTSNLTSCRSRLGDPVKYAKFSSLPQFQISEEREDTPRDGAYPQSHPRRTLGLHGSWCSALGIWKTVQFISILKGSDFGYGYRGSYFLFMAIVTSVYARKPCATVPLYLRHGINTQVCLKGEHLLDSTKKKCSD